MNEVESLIAALQRDDSEALDVALRTWLRYRAPELAELVIALDERLQRDFVGPKAPSRDAFHAAWKGLADQDPSPVATGWLCATVSQKLPIEVDRFGILRPDYIVERFAALFERIARLRDRVPDPRVARAALDVLARGEHSYYGEVEAIYRPVLELLVAAGDPSIAGPLRELLATPRAKMATVREWTAEQLPAVIERIEALSPTALPAELRDAVRSTLPRSPRRRRDPSATLLQHVYADPDDLEARAVLADTWIEEGDPRGTFVARQLASPDDDAETRGLLRAHRAEWLGPDLDATLQVTFANGFPYEAVLRENHVASEEVWTAATVDERLATLEVLRQGKGNRRWYQQFVTSPAARHLAVIEVPSGPFFEAIAERPHATLARLELGMATSPAMLRALAERDAFANVRELRMPAPGDVSKWLRSVARAGLAPRLECLELTQNPRKAARDSILAQWPAVLEGLPALRRFAVRSYAACSAEYVRRADGFVLRLGPAGRLGQLLILDGPRWVSIIEGAAPPILVRGPRNIEPLELPEQVVRAEVDAPPDACQALAERWGIPVEPW